MTVFGTSEDVNPKPGTLNPEPSTLKPRWWLGVRLVTAGTAIPWLTAWSLCLRSRQKSKGLGFRV